LCEHGNKTIAQIASDSGFGGSAYFSSSFHQHYGMSPSDYRRNVMKREEVRFF
jgi:AraC-like DNA-binding protein